MLENGADVTCKAADDSTALHVIADSGSENFVFCDGFLRMLFVSSTKQMFRLVGGNAETMSLLLDHGGVKVIDAEDKRGHTPLLVAVTYKKKDIIELLVNYWKIDMDIINTN